MFCLSQLFSFYLFEIFHYTVSCSPHCLPKYKKTIYTCLCVQLEKVNWEMGLQMAQSATTKMKTPNALFELVVQDKEVVL